MGSTYGFICRTCGRHFVAKYGGGFVFDLLHCDRCGADRAVSHQELGDIHLRFVKGLPGPYAIARSQFDRRIQREYPGEPISEGEYHGLAEATLEACSCGGSYRYDAPARCPGCRSLGDQWDADPSGSMALYD